MLKVLAFDNQNSQLWDDFVAKCPMSTFLHSRKFLSYHKDRFVDQSLLLYDDKDRLCGVFPAAVNQNNNLSIVSHPGITFGGILHQGKLIGAKMREAFDSIIAYYQKQSFKELVYKPVPHFYHQAPAEDDIYALFSLNAELIRCDLSCAIDLQANFSLLTNHDQSKMRNCLRKAEKNNVNICEGREYLPEFWDVLTFNLQEKYATKPVHSFEEILLLHDLFPNEIKTLVAVMAGKVVAGTTLFRNKQALHTQYLTVTQAGSEVFALDSLISHCINLAQQEGFRYFDFGINNEKAGRVLNNNLYLFKAKHGGSGVVHYFYRLNLG